MKINLFRLIILASTSFHLTNALAEDKEESELAQQAKVKIQAFAKELKIHLQGAIKNGGLEAGIEVCHQKAPEIAQNMSTNGWTISRTSLKTRNDSNRPTVWQKQVLLQFEQELEKGKPITQLGFSHIDDSSFKLMKPIPTAELCLSCHGSNIPELVENKIKKLYPNDKAVNFSLNEIRGAFVAEKQF